jgi:hypothetical protein
MNTELTGDLKTKIKIERRGFLVPRCGSNAPRAFLQGEQITDEVKRLLQEHEILTAVMNVEVTPEFWAQEQRKIEEWCDDSDNKACEPVLATCMKEWTAKCGWVCLAFLNDDAHGSLQFNEHGETASGNLLIYVYARTIPLARVTAR